MDMGTLEEELRREKAKLAGLKREMWSNPNFLFFWSTVWEQRKYVKELEKQVESLSKKSEEKP